MRNCIFGVWHAQEALPLFDDLKIHASDEEPLILAEFEKEESAPQSRISNPNPKAHSAP